MRMLTNARCRSVAYLLLGGWLAIPAGAAERAIDWSDPPQGVFVDDWMVVELEGQKIGYAHSQMARDGDEIQTTNLMALELRRAGANVPIKVLQTTRETLAGKTRAFTSLLDASAMAMQKQGLIHDGKVVVRSNQFGVESKAEYDFPQGAVMSWGALRRQHTEGYAPGTEYTVQIYEPAFSENMAVPVTMRIGEKEALEIGGATFETIRSTQTMMGMTTTAWMDATGRIVRTELPMMGLPMVMTRSTRAEAMAKFESPEFFMPTTIRSPRPIDREKARLIEFELRLKDDSVVMPEIPTTGMQQPRAIVAAAESERTKSAAGRVRLVVQRQDHTALAKTPTTEYGPKWNEFLAPNALINSDDPAVVAMARTARGMPGFPMPSRIASAATSPKSSPTRTSPWDSPPPARCAATRRGTVANTRCCWLRWGGRAGFPPGWSPGWSMCPSSAVTPTSSASTCGRSFASGTPGSILTRPSTNRTAIRRTSPSALVRWPGRASVRSPSTWST
jgi:hypothetical protein